VNRASRSASRANESGRTFSATSRFSLVSRPHNLAHSAFADQRGDLVDAETRAGSEGHGARLYGPEELVALDDALEALAKIDERKSRSSSCVSLAD
jgi:hypothetical protein